MGNELVKTNGNGKAPIVAGGKGLQLRSLDDFYRFAQYVATSGIAPKGLGKPEQILVALQYGAELGLSPMQTLSTVMVVNQRAALFGDGMLAVVQASGHMEDISETIEGSGDQLKATCRVKRRDRPSPVVKSFSWQQAKQAALVGSDTYKKYPERMLQHRARSLALRDAFPDVLCGILTVEEAQEIASDSKPAFVDGAAQPADDLDILAGEVIDRDDVSQEWPTADEVAADEARLQANGTLFDASPAYE